MSDQTWDFSDLTALYFNCTLTRSPEPSHTGRLIDNSKAIMDKHGVKTEVIRAIDHDIATGIYPDMREHGWETDEWPEIYEKVKTADIVVKHYFQPRREEFRRLLASKLPGVIGDPSVHEKPVPEETDLRAQLAQMGPGSWEAVRDKLLGALDEERKVAEAKLVSKPLTPFLIS